MNMQITWNGLGSFSISTKPIQGEVTVVTDPFSDKVGVKLPRALTASIILQSHGGDMASNVKAVTAEEGKHPFVISYAGEFEVKGVFVHGIRAPKKSGEEHTIYRISTEGIRIAFLGALDRTLKDDELKRLGDVDILIVPVGGNDVASKTIANDIVSQVEPRVVIPSHYEIKGLKEKQEGVEGFCKEVACPNEEMNKYKVNKKTLPQEDMQMVILSK